MPGNWLEKPVPVDSKCVGMIREKVSLRGYELSVAKVHIAPLKWRSSDFWGHFEREPLRYAYIPMIPVPRI